YETPPFHLIENSHFRPAVEEAIQSASEEIKVLTENQEQATFENTIEALERCGGKLTRISLVLFNLNNAETSKELQEVAREVSPLLARFSNDITLNEKLFSRIRTIYDSRDSLNLSSEKVMLLEKKFRDFKLGGAGLKSGEKARFREISEELSQLTLKFEENVLAETNSFELHLTDPADLAGLPVNIREMASMEAKNREKDGWVLTLNFPSYIPFMQYSEKRELREKMLKAYSSRAFHGDERDNRLLLSRIVNLRLETAKLLGFKNYAEMTLGDRMAENPSKVMAFLEEIYSASRNAALRDFNKLKEYAAGTGHTGNIERWDWAFYSEKLKKAKYDIDDEILRPYFRLDKVQQAIFILASRLYGLRFKENTTLPVYHKEVRTWEVMDEDNNLLSILYLDYHPRKGKSGGAWMTSYRDQRMENGRKIIPIISLVTNFTRPTTSKPSLLTFNELTTFLHEFGHALHGMLSQCTYESIAGTNVARDFVELPSQLMENWAFEQDWLDSWATHYVTGEKIPFEITEKIREASTFNEGYNCLRQLGFGFLDMAWHSITEPFKTDVVEFESHETEKTELFPKIESTNMSCAFTHLFGGGYAAGYYGYKWAEVLDADAFKYFKEAGLHNRIVADSFRKNILEKGGSDKPM
ncbi:MAG: M3 family metallopeptidase, partial [Bacteroidales bacterium]